jgi:hypothetical protein
MTHQTIITVDKIVMVNLDENGNPAPHGKTKVEFVKDRLNNNRILMKIFIKNMVCGRCISAVELFLMKLV